MAMNQHNAACSKCGTFLIQHRRTRDSFWRDLFVVLGWILGVLLALFFSLLVGCAVLAVTILLQISAGKETVLVCPACKHEEVVFDD